MGRGIQRPCVKSNPMACITCRPRCSCCPGERRRRDGFGVSVAQGLFPKGGEKEREVRKNSFNGAGEARVQIDPATLRRACIRKSRRAGTFTREAHLIQLWTHRSSDVRRAVRQVCSHKEVARLRASTKSAGRLSRDDDRAISRTLARCHGSSHAPSLCSIQSASCGFVIRSCARAARAATCSRRSSVPPPAHNSRVPEVPLGF